MNSKNEIISYLKKTLIFIIVSMILLTVILSVGAYLINKEIIQISSSKYIVPIAYFLLGVLSSSVNVSKGTKSALKNTAILLLLITVLIGACSILAYSGSFSFKPAYLIAMILGAIIPLLVQNRVRIGGKKIRYKYKNS